MSATQYKRERVTTISSDIYADRIAQLRTIFPDAFVEGKLDFAKLRDLLGDDIDERAERYTFAWAGKCAARRLAQLPSLATLVPAPYESINFETTHNLFIEGDNLEVLKLLYRAYYARIKLIYIDPPYNTGNDFVYPDDYTAPLDTYLKLTGQKNDNGDLLTSNPETNGRYHSRWLSMMYPRLFVARQLLRDDGVIFVSIDDHEVHNLRALMNEVFGEENFIATIIWEKVYSPRMDTDSFSVSHDYILVYGRSSSVTVAQTLFQQNERQFAFFDEKKRQKYRRRSLRKEGKDSLRVDVPSMFFPIEAPDGTKVYPIKPDGTEGRWRWSPQKYEKEKALDNVEWVKVNGVWQIYVKQYYKAAATRPPVTLWKHEEAGHNHEAQQEIAALCGPRVFETPKPKRLITRILEIATQPDNTDIVLDFFAGSGTTAHAVLELNQLDGGDRRFIMVQFPEPTQHPQYPTIADIGKERIRRVIGRLKVESTQRFAPADRKTPGELGFRAFKLARSNYRRWPGYMGDNADDYIQLALSFAELLIDGWQPDNVLWEVVLKEGLSLTSRVETIEDAEPNTVRRVVDPDTGFSLYICLDDRIDPRLQDKLALGAEDLFVCRDSAIDEMTYADLSLRCRIKTL